MSGVSKILEKDETHLTPSKRLFEDSSSFSNCSGKLLHSVIDESHLPFESRMDGRSAKVHQSDNNRIEKLLSILRNTKDAKDTFSGRVVKEGSDYCNSNVAVGTWQENREAEKELKVGKTVHCNVPNKRTVGVDEVGNIHFQADFKTFSVDPVVSVDRKLDVLGEKNFREKDIKAKDERYKCWRGSNEDKNDLGSSMHLGVVSNDLNKLLEKVDMLHRERIENKKENKRKEKNSPKKELSDVDGMRCVQYGKLFDGREKIEKLEFFGLEPAQINTYILYGNFGVKNKENVINVQGERHGKLHSHVEETADRSVGDRVAQKGSGAFSQGFQQSKKMDCSSFGLSTPKLEPHFSSETCDSEGYQGKPSVSPILYKPCESMPELLKSWKEFEASLSNTHRDIVLCWPILEFRIPSQHISFANHQLRHAQLWGTDVYTIDSDIVSVLIHTGYCLPPSSALSDAFDELWATIRVLPPQDCYLSSARNNIHSRAWGSSAHCSYRIESCSIVKKGCDKIKLEPCFSHISVPEPTIAPLPSECILMTRDGAPSNAMLQQRFVQEVPVLFNLCNEPWTKYSISIVADKGMRKSLYTSTRLKKGDVLYLETHFNRYELCFNGEKIYCNSTSSTCQNPKVKEKHVQHNVHVQVCDWNVMDHETIVDVFRWSRCRKALPQKVMRCIGIPLPAEHLEVLKESLDWEDIQWSQDGVWIAGTEYKLVRVHFISPK